MQRIYEINELARRCGYFYNALLSEEGMTYNNGYNCRHPEQKERETNSQNGHSVGACYAWSCPLGYEAGEEDFVSQEIDSRGYTEWEENVFIVVEEETDDYRRNC